MIIWEDFLKIPYISAKGGGQMKLFLMGKAGCGKDTVADYLVDKHGFTKFRLAQALEDLCRIKHGMKGKDRELMIRVGEKYKDCFGQDYWLQLVADQVKQSSTARIVISDEIGRASCRERV